MRRPTTVALFVVVAANLAGAQDAPRGGKIEWRSDLEAGLAEARRDGRPAMLYFTDDG